MRSVAAPPTDDAAVIAASLDDPGRFAQVYEKHAGKLYGYAYRRVGREIAEDVVADAFVAAFRARRGGVRGPGGGLGVRPGMAPTAGRRARPARPQGAGRAPAGRLG
ncbi:RNA polymerase sigma factor [Micromonospora sp. LOL_021]|uniref:RNA polymerase sigma factor n=1 Tax=Micromonospora sp. LOL_021 TaxID=3345417 RepID=UPI003A860C75